MSFQFFYLAVSVLVAFFFAEVFISFKENKHLYKRDETMNNIMIGVGLFFVNFVSRTITLSAWYMVYSVRLFTMPNSWVIWLVNFLLCDFTYYWYHRISHNVNWLWAAHSIHHSSEHFNISVSFRQSWFNQFSGYFIFYLWLPFLGFDPAVVYIASGIALFYQSWLHTEIIGRLHPAIEFIFNTPSHHRVHHACNLKYLDKNHAAVLIIWDRLFCTFAEEEEKPHYGVTTKLLKPDLINIMFTDWKSLFSRVIKAQSFKTAVNYLIKPPGWSHDGSSKTVKELRKEIEQNNCFSKYTSVKARHIYLIEPSPN
ncbi:MAG TPA: sterol desaturase family protein [Panacibacter sp.]|nr:sterol desaturase family protein [Panacibacter sp.]